MKSNFILTILIIFIIYLFYQSIIRNSEIYNIRKEWILKNDIRWYKYSYNKMFYPSSINYFGLKYPTDSNFK